MYTLMYVYTYVCIHLCMSTLMYVYTYVCIHLCMSTLMYVYTYVCLHLCMSTLMYVYTYVCMYTLTYVCLHLCMYTLMYVSPSLYLHISFPLSYTTAHPPATRYTSTVRTLPRTPAVYTRTPTELTLDQQVIITSVMVTSGAVAFVLGIAIMIYIW